jgi:hypothetical protein
MDPLVTILILVLFFVGSGLGYSQYGYVGGVGIGGLMLIVLVVYLIFG